MFQRTFLALAFLTAAGCAVAPDAVRRMDATRIQSISDYRLCDAAAVNLDLRGQRYPVIESEIIRRGISCAEHIAAVVSDCSGLQVLNSGVDGTGQGVIFTVRNDRDEARSFRIRHDERQSRMFTIGPATTERFGITADPNVERLDEPVEITEGDGGIELLECREVRDSYRFNYRPQAQSSPRAAAAVDAALPMSPTAQGVRSRATRSVNMRAGPGTNHAVVRTLPAGEEVTVLGVVGTWCEVVTSGRGRAYVSCTFLSPPLGGWAPLARNARPPPSARSPRADRIRLTTIADAFSGSACRLALTRAGAVRGSRALVGGMDYLGDAYHLGINGREYRLSSTRDFFNRVLLSGDGRVTVRMRDLQQVWTSGSQEYPASMHRVALSITADGATQSLTAYQLCGDDS
jgi:hypothetical protein